MKNKQLSSYVLCICMCLIITFSCFIFVRILRLFEQSFEQLKKVSNFWFSFHVNFRFDSNSHFVRILTSIWTVFCTNETWFQILIFHLNGDLDSHRVLESCQGRESFSFFLGFRLELVAGSSQVFWLTFWCWKPLLPNVGVGVAKLQQLLLLLA